MKSKSIARWGLIVALGLVGCTAGVPAVVKAPPASDASGVAADETRQLGNLVMRIQWPLRPRATQAIPVGADVIEIAVLSKNGQTLDKKEVKRPSGDAPVSVVSFQIAPSHGKVDVTVIVRGNGKILAQGGKKDVVLRDNTSTGVSITLDSETSVSVRVARQIVLLKDLHRYFERFENWKDPRTFPDVQAMESALRAVADGYNASGQGLWQATRFGSNLASVDGAPGVQERWHLPYQPGVGLDLRDREILKAFWPGYQIAQTFTKTPAQRRLELALNPDSASGDQTRAQASLELSAPWVADPQLHGAFTGVGAQSATPVPRAVMLFGGERPVPEEITALSATAQIDPQGLTAQRFKGSVSLTNVQDAGATAMMAAIRNANPYMLTPWTRFPTRAEASVEFPSLHAAVVAAVGSDFQTGNAQLRLAPRDKFGTRSAFQVEADASVRVAPKDGKTLLTGGTINFRFDDELEALRLEGNATLETEPLRLVIEARFVDIPSATVIGRIDYSAPFDERGNLNPNKNETWPYLVLMDGANGSPGTSIHLTPGLFTGRKTGDVNVYIY